MKRLSNSPAWGKSPSWSPTGDVIAFESDRDGNKEIYIVDSNGSGLKQLTNTDRPERATFGSWSPDGEKIAYTVGRGPKFGLTDIYVMNADGSGQKRLTRTKGNDVDPSWSSDGEKIAFESTRDGNSEVYIMNPDGSSQKRLTHHSGKNYGADWSPLQSSAIKEQNPLLK